MKRLVIQFQTIRVGSSLIKLPCGDRYLRSRDRFDVSPEFRHCRVKFAFEYPNPRERLRFFPREFLLPNDADVTKVSSAKLVEALGAARSEKNESAPSLQHRFRELLGKTRLLHRVG